LAQGEISRKILFVAAMVSCLHSHTSFEPSPCNNGPEASEDWFGKMIIEYQEVAMPRCDRPLVTRDSSANCEVREPLVFKGAGRAMRINSGKRDDERNDERRRAAYAEQVAYLERVAYKERVRRASEERSAYQERVSAPPPAFPRSRKIGESMQINGLSGPICQVPFDQDLLQLGMGTGTWDLVRRLKEQVQEYTGISVWEQRLQIDASWLQATLVRVTLPELYLHIEDRISMDLQAGGRLQLGKCEGNLFATAWVAGDAETASIRFAAPDAKFRRKVHPRMNKASVEQGILEARDSNRGLPINTPSSVLKWKAISDLDVAWPVKWHCFVSSAAGGRTNVRVELELLEAVAALHDIHICFPLVPQSSRPVVESQSPGVAKSDVNPQLLQWHIPVMNDQERWFRFEFSVDMESCKLFPCTLEATRWGETESGVQVSECYHPETLCEIPYALEVSSIYNLSIHDFASCTSASRSSLTAANLDDSLSARVLLG